MDLIVQIAISAVVLVMMTSMGLELTVADFRGLIEQPRGAAVGLTGQLVGLPLLGIAFAHLAGLPPELAVGVVIITACPGSAPSNAFSLLGGGNVALSISLTAISGVVTAFTIPVWVNLGLSLFLETGSGGGGLPLARTFAQLFVLVILPVALGMTIRARAPRTAERLRPYVRRGVAILLAVAMVGIVYLSRVELMRDLPVAGVLALVLVSLALSLGYAAAWLARLEPRDRFTLSIEVGLQNGALASLVVFNLLEQPALIVFPGAYALVSLLPVTAWAFVAGRRVRSSAARPR